jgi:hypothetical protein
MNFKHCLGLTVCFLALCAAPARATIIPTAADAFASADDTSGEVNQGLPPQAAIADDPFGGYASASVTLGRPSVTASILMGTSAGLTPNSEASETYAFTIIGPPDLSNIPVTILGKTSINENGGIAEAEASVKLGGTVLSDIDTGSCTECVSSFISHQSLTTDTIYTISLFALAESGEGSPSAAGTHITASADPFVQIDADFLLTHPGLSLEFSDGIVNAPVSAVPLPASLPMFTAAILGLLGVSAMARRRKHGLTR